MRRRVVRAVRGMGQVPGRFERIAAQEVGFEVIVDYAHTDVGLEAVLGVARGLAEAGGGRVICVFGAAGERDGAKRPKMGRVGLPVGGPLASLPPTMPTRRTRRR